MSQFINTVEAAPEVVLGRADSTAYTRRLLTGNVSEAKKSARAKVYDFLVGDGLERVDMLSLPGVDWAVENRLFALLRFDPGKCYFHGFEKSIQVLHGSFGNAPNSGKGICEKGLWQKIPLDGGLRMESIRNACARMSLFDVNHFLPDKTAQNHVSFNCVWLDYTSFLFADIEYALYHLPTRLKPEGRSAVVVTLQRCRERGNQNLMIQQYGSRGRYLLQIFRNCIKNRRLNLKVKLVAKESYNGDRGACMGNYYFEFNEK